MKRGLAGKWRSRVVRGNVGAKVRWGLVVTAAAWAGGGCTYVNRPLDSVSVPVEQRRRNETRASTAAGMAMRQSREERMVVPSTRAATRNVTEATKTSAGPGDGAAAGGYFVGVALSGGGSRSANFSAACMFQLQRVGVLKHVNYISSVSGGSLAGAYFCLNGDGKGGWEPAAAQKKMTHSFATDVFVQTMLPWNWFALTLTNYDRSDILAESFEKALFSRRGRALTFGDLRADRPHLLINATDLQSGRRFVFCDESFDEINSDLSKYPIAHAVAASAAVPVLMHQVTLRDFSTVFKQYRHLIDGGVADNLGVQTLVETYDAQMAGAERAGRAAPYPKGAVMIVIDARTQYDARLSDKGDIGFWQSVALGTGLASTALVNRASSATMADVITRYSQDNVTAKELREEMAQLEDTGYVKLRDRWGHPVEVLHLALGQVGTLSDRPYHGFAGSVNSVGTYFDISDNEAYELYEAAELLVKEKFEGRLRGIAEELGD